MGNNDDGAPPGGWKVSSPLAGWNRASTVHESGAEADVNFDFAGKVAIVTGGSNGIGRAVCEAMRDAGADVDVWDLDSPSFEGVAHAAVDVTDAQSVAASAAGLMERFGRIDILINNAGFAGTSAPLDDFDPGEWRRIVEVNLTGVFEVCRHIVPHMRRRDWGRIVNIAARAGQEGTPNASAYSAAKAGVIALSQSVAKELAETGIQVNCIAPARGEEQADIVRTILGLASDSCTFSLGSVVEIMGAQSGSV